MKSEKVSSGRVASAIKEYEKVLDDARALMNRVMERTFNESFAHKKKGIIGFRKPYTMDDMIDVLEKRGDEYEFVIFTEYMTEEEANLYSRCYIVNQDDDGEMSVVFRYPDAVTLLQRSLNNLESEITCNGRYLDFVNDFEEPR